ncbi:MAG TPA: PQQ-dependent sugar dehydrogenase [Steroidobacteraceae bacterium]|nr:PQQ-dependent sugar dehydrogenase [Steroidobacteraceae bacterium]
MKFTTAVAVTAALAGFAATAMGADANAGRTFFRTQCALCHSAEPNDNGGAQGPNLQGVVGRKAATGSGFSYSAALKSSGLTWDAATLQRFLASPTTVVPGSAMVIPVPQQADRENIVAYFTGVRDGTLVAPRAAGGPPGGNRPPPAAAAPTKGEADWKKDAPGRVHRVDLAKLPAPFDTPSANNFPQLVPKPADAKLSLPPGFKIDVYLTGLTGPREMKVAANGDVLLAETNGGRIKVLRPSADGSTATATVFAQGLLQPYGIALYPSASNPQWLYVAETNRVVRYRYKTGDTVASSVPEVIIPQLSPVGGGHFTRDLAFSPDGRRMYVSVGSQSNVAEDIARKSPAEVKAWEAQHGLGAAWGNEENRAGVRVFDVSGANGKNFATGIRNCVGMTVQPATGALWCVTNERDMLGDDLVPDYATRVKEGAYYGWPWYYMGNHEDPRLKDHRPDLAGKATVPDVPFTAHSAAVNILFYTANNGRSAFPSDYTGDAFAVLHGSWNRAFRTGHKIVRLPMKNGVPTGEYIDFMTGFITPDGNAWGRPVAITQLQDGSMLLADDGSNQIYRITYTAPR